MATAFAAQSAHPLPAYNFQVTVGSLAMGFAEVSGLQRHFETLSYRHGLSFSEGEDIVRFAPGRWAPITLKRGVVKGLAELRAWLEEGDVRTLGVSLCDHEGVPVVTWRVRKALPTQLDAPAFAAAGNEAAVESLTVMAVGITVEDH